MILWDHVTTLFPNNLTEWFQHPLMIHAYINCFSDEGMKNGGFLMLSLLLLYWLVVSQEEFFFFLACLFEHYRFFSFNFLYYFTIIFFVWVTLSPNLVKVPLHVYFHVLWHEPVSLWVLPHLWCPRFTLYFAPKL